MEEPARLRTRPHHGKFPIPYVTAIVDGKPDFRDHDDENRRRVASRSLCQLCGQGLDPEIVFVGYEEAAHTHTFGEPPMHEDCFRYAASVCPWLAGAGWSRRWRHEANNLSLAPEPAERPGTLIIYFTKGFESIRDPSEVSSILYRAGPPSRRPEYLYR